MENQSPQGSSFDAHKLQATYSYNQPSRRNPKRAVFVLIILLLLGAGVFFGMRAMSGSRNTAVVPSVTPTPTPETVPTDTPAVESITPTVSSKETPTPSPKPTSNPVDKATGLDRSTLSVIVQNGSGEVGAASKGSDTLKSFGYKVASSGNADNFNYDSTTIQVKSDKSSFLALLKKDLATVYTIGTASADLSASSSADAIVIVGKK